MLRECLKCNGTDDALMTRKADNERTLLMSRWFHCVKLPPDVLEQDHPFHVLFGGETPGHLFLSRWDGTSRTELTGAQSRTELWDLMGSLLASEYKKSPESGVKQLLSVLDEFDRIDEEIQSIKGEIDDELEGQRPDSSKLPKLQKKLAELEQSKAEKRARAVQLSDLQLKESKKTAKTPSEAAPAGG